MRQFFFSRLLSFRHAFAGIGYLLRTQKNAWIHTVIFALALLLAAWLQLPPGDWVLILLTAGLVFGAELINTSIEAVVDLASPDLHPLARAAKDTAAAAVLLAAFMAIFIGLLILGLPLWNKMSPLLK
jgi:diacylglycerol kinase